MRQYRGQVKSTDPDISKRWAYGWYVEIEGRSFIVPDDAGIEPHMSDYTVFGIIEVQKETVRQSN